jgi:hypothetical protein
MKAGRVNFLWQCNQVTKLWKIDDIQHISYKARHATVDFLGDLALSIMQSKVSLCGLRQIVTNGGPEMREYTLVSHLVPNMPSSFHLATASDSVILYQQPAVGSK